MMNTEGEELQKLRISLYLALEGFYILQVWSAAALYRQDPFEHIIYSYWKLNHLCLPFAETMNMYPPMKDSRQQL